MRTMSHEAISERNRCIAKMLGWKYVDKYILFDLEDDYPWDYKDGVWYDISISNKRDIRVDGKRISTNISAQLIFDQSWEWLMHASDFICKLGYRKFVTIYGSNCRCAFTDDSNKKQFHPFGGGNMICDSDSCDNEINATFIAVSDFAKLYINNKL